MSDNDAGRRLVLSIAEAAQLLGISDDLAYDLAARGELPCLHLGRRKVVPTRAIEMILDRSLESFDPDVLRIRLPLRAN